MIDLILNITLAITILLFFALLLESLYFAVKGDRLAIVAAVFCVAIIVVVAYGLYIQCDDVAIFVRCKW